jgi:hypothetical protein
VRYAFSQKTQQLAGGIAGETLELWRMVDKLFGVTSANLLPAVSKNVE